MSMKNLIKPFLDQKGITPYRFWHDTGISRVTAYKLYNDSTYIPGADVLVSICDTYMIQPGLILEWVSDDDSSLQENTSVESEGITTKSKDKTSKNVSVQKKRNVRSLLEAVCDLPETA
jgi:DNA-binding Xre family transcriptional regulator